MDVAAGGTIWFGPDFKKKESHTPPPAKPYDGAKGYSDYFLSFAHDFNGDGWADILVYGFPGAPAWLYLNPKGKGGDWAKHNIFDFADGESPGLTDMNGDGKPELLVHTSDLVKAPNKGRTGGQFGYAEIDWANPTGKAKFHPITAKSPANDNKIYKYTHGYGAGDVNGDGLVDILEKDGWYEQPKDLAKGEPWKFHPVKFAGHGGAQMYVYDVNGDGRPDVITSDNGHGYGLSWFEQNSDGTFTEHKLLGTTKADAPLGVNFSQIHAIELVDVNGDGLKDIVCGKRRWAHGPKGDVDPSDDPVLYWFELKRDGKGGATYVPHLIDNDSGVGTQVSAGDVNKDGKTELGTAVDALVANPADQAARQKLATILSDPKNALARSELLAHMVGQAATPAMYGELVRRSGSASKANKIIQTLTDFLNGLYQKMFVNVNIYILFFTKRSVSAVNNTSCPCTKGTPSILYPLLPSIVENTSLVNVSMTSTSSTARVPKLNNFKSALNSIIGRTALRL
jgi:hypothetical protein